MLCCSWIIYCHCLHVMNATAFRIYQLWMHSRCKTWSKTIAFRKWSGNYKDVLLWKFACRIEQENQIYTDEASARNKLYWWLTKRKPHSIQIQNTIKAFKKSNNTNLKWIQKQPCQPSLSKLCERSWRTFSLVPFEQCATPKPFVTPCASCLIVFFNIIPANW